MGNVGESLLANTEFLIRNLEEIPGIGIRGATATKGVPGILQTVTD